MAILDQNKTKEVLKPYQALMDAELEKLFSDSGFEKFSGPLGDSIKYSVLNGGKRLRPILSLLSAEAILKSEDQLQDNPAMGLALALELVHCASLIHDDLPCMDDDDLRRGKATNHKVYGEAIALLAGDFLLCYPLEILITKTPSSAQNLKQVQVEFIQAINKMILGQALDLEYSEHPSIKNPRLNKSIDDLKEMQSLKTGALLSASVKLAALLAGASLSQVNALELYANNLGLAFQITDDILDHTSSPEEMGKATGKDNDLNKFTYVQSYGLERAKEIAEDLVITAKNTISTENMYFDKLNLVAGYVVSRTN